MNQPRGFGTGIRDQIGHAGWRVAGGVQRVHGDATELQRCALLDAHVDTGQTVHRGRGDLAVSQDVLDVIKMKQTVYCFINQKIEFKLNMSFD